MSEPAAHRQRPIGFWLKLVDRLIDEAFDAVLSTDGLTRRHWQVLDMLRRGATSGPALADRLAPFLSAAEPDVEPVLADLAGRGWVALDGDGARLTDAGAAAHQRLRTGVAATRERLVDGLTPEQYAATVDVLRRMAANLGWAEQ